jgi:DtxR family Mn-dependent transcriptional regulator
MLPSSTVENYLKVIFQQQIDLPPESLVPMGQVAAAMSVTPGTATTMVKTLADSGLVQYEPYSGVRLTGAGERLAGLVIRRHRLIEQFLVEVMGMSWDEVHDEAEKLEHAVSERLIDRMDEMLGRPRVDPHGDPIPSADGSIAHRELNSLLTCPLDVPVMVTRVIDQDAGFLRFLEQSNLKPGEEVHVEARDAAADSVRVRTQRSETLTIGARAASKLLVEVASTVLLLLAVVLPARGQVPAAAATGADQPFAITDNSFFIEEAFNQEPGIFQNIVTALREEGGAWGLQFTQEWPAPSMRHQVSYTMTLLSLDGETGAGNVLLNYRYQLAEEGPGRPAISPRVSLVVPVGDEDRGLGNGSWGWQLNLPVSKQVRDFYFHGNVGLTWWPDVSTHRFAVDGSAGDVGLTSPFLGGSTIYRVAPMFNVLLEALVDWREFAAGPGRTDRETITVVSPGARGGWNIGDKQLVLGAAVPVTWVDETTSVGIFGYFSYELPFRP